MRAPPVYFDDFIPGMVREFGRYTVTANEIVEFASKYDPQPFHVDAEAAKSSIYGGLIASGWMTCAIAMRMACEEFVLKAASMGSPGVDQIRWKQPVRPDDVLRMRVMVLETRASQSKSDRGIVRTRWEVLNQRDEVVMTSEGMGIYRRRAAAAG